MQPEKEGGFHVETEGRKGRTFQCKECVGESRRGPESERFFDWQGRRNRRYRCISSMQPDAVQSGNKPLEARSDSPTGS
jgi:hypothetical protein